MRIVSIVREPRVIPPPPPEPKVTEIVVALTREEAIALHVLLGYEDAAIQASLQRYNRTITACGVPIPAEIDMRKALGYGIYQDLGDALTGKS